MDIAPTRAAILIESARTIEEGYLLRFVGKKAIEFLNSDEGPTATEYAIMLALIAIGVMVAMAAFGERMTAIYTSIHAKTPDL